jgi:putative flippase GtrA
VTVRKILLFGAIGLAATGTHLGGALLARRLGALGPLQANTVGYACAFLVSYVGNARFTFRQALLHRGRFLRFAAGSGLAYGLSQLIVFTGVELLHQPFAQVILWVVVVVPLFSFAIANGWIFVVSTLPAAGHPLDAEAPPGATPPNLAG